MVTIGSDMKPFHGWELKDGVALHACPAHIDSLAQPDCAMICQDRLN